MKSLLEKLGSIGRRVSRELAPQSSAEPVVLRPEGKERGCIALSYITWPFREGWDSPKARGHTNAFEVVAMAEAWLDQGFRVEVCDYDDLSYTPPTDCMVAIDLHSNLEKWKNNLREGCVKILHATGCHWRTHNKAELDRIDALRQRRGVSLQPKRQVAPNLAAEIADEITVLGNEHTIGTYVFVGKPITRIPISSAYEFAWPEDKNFEEAKRRFLWIGSYGMVHKGLDLVLEAFAATPDLHLTVCGRPEKEADFFAAYEKELTRLPNIHLRGWVDLGSPEFGEIARTHAAVVYPSAAEGGGGAVIHCMHAGLLPICTAEASVNTGDFGISVDAAHPEAVRAAVENVACRPSEEVSQMAQGAWQNVRGMHSRANFKTNYRNFTATIVSKLPGN